MSYSTGTVTVTNGSKTVTGVGTAWTALGSRDIFFRVPGLGQPQVAFAVTDNTHLTLDNAWGGVTKATMPYVIDEGVGLPAEQVADAHLLTADGYVKLYKLSPVGGGTVYFKPDKDETWQGNLYEGQAVQLTGVGRSADGELARPILSVNNPMAIYSALIAAKTLDNATVVEKTVLYAHVLSDSNISTTKTWKVRRVASLNKALISLELRDFLDGQQFLLPGRFFQPPDFPSVSL